MKLFTSITVSMLLSLFFSADFTSADVPKSVYSAINAANLPYHYGGIVTAKINNAPLDPSVPPKFRTIIKYLGFIAQYYGNAIDATEPGGCQAGLFALGNNAKFAGIFSANLVKIQCTPQITTAFREQIENGLTLIQTDLPLVVAKFQSVCPDDAGQAGAYQTTIADALALAMAAYVGVCV